MTSQQQTLFECQTSTLHARDFLAKIIALFLQSEQDLKGHEVAYSMKYAESHSLKNLNIFSLRMSKDCFQSVENYISETSLLPWRSWGISLNGRCVTADVYYHTTDPECLLSDIVETCSENQYSLSLKSLTYLMNQQSQKRNKALSIVCLHAKEAPRSMKLTSASKVMDLEDLHQGNCSNCKASCQSMQTKQEKPAFQWENYGDKPAIA